MMVFIRPSYQKRKSARRPWEHTAQGAGGGEQGAASHHPPRGGAKRTSIGPPFWAYRALRGHFCQRIVRCLLDRGAVNGLRMRGGTWRTHGALIFLAGVQRPHTNTNVQGCGEAMQAQPRPWTFVCHLDNTPTDRPLYSRARGRALRVCRDRREEMCHSRARWPCSC